MAEQEHNRSEPASPHKLREARRRGNVPRSADLNALMVVAALLACLQLWAGGAGLQQALLSRLLLLQAGSFGFSDAQVWQWLSEAASQALVMLVPLLGAVMLAGSLSSLLQHGPLFSTQPIKPDLQRLNPVAGLQRIFSRRALFELGKNLLKLGLFAAMLALSVRDLLPELVGLLSTDPHAHGPLLLRHVDSLVFRLLLVMLLVALVDLLFTRWEYADKLRMSRRELRDEHKQREGDPKIKARIRELQNERRARHRALRAVPDSDVLITNPTHVGVALVYRHGEMAAPGIVAKGAGELLERMKALARRHGVPIVENRPLARALYALDLREAVPEAHYADVARILVWVQQARRARRPEGAAA